jgi:hypothetical protein
MTEFYTAEVMAEIWNNELEAERMLDAYDPYMDYEDDFEEDTQDDYDFEGNEDRGMEGYLFGWDA